MNKFPTKTLEVEMWRVKPNPWNPNKQNEEMFKKEVASIEKHGLLVFPLVREHLGAYQIIDGEHRWLACKALGYTFLKVESLGEVEETDAKTLTLILNNIHGKDDVIKRAQILRQLNEGQLALFPMAREEIEEELKMLNFDFEQFANAEFAPHEKEPLKEAVRKMQEAAIWLRKHHDSIKDPTTRLLIERFEQMVQLFTNML